MISFLPFFQEDDVELDYTWFELYEENNGRTHVGPDGLNKVMPNPDSKVNQTDKELIEVPKAEAAAMVAAAEPAE